MSRPPAALVPAIRPWLIGRAGQGDPRAGSGQGVYRLGGVAHGVNVRVRGFHAPVGLYATGGADFHAGGSRQSDLRFDADTEEDEIGRQRGAIGELDPGGSKGGGTRLDAEIEVRPAGGILQVRGHVGIEQGKNVRIALHDRDVDAAPVKGLGHLQADEAAADDHRATRLAFGDEGHDAVHIGYVAQGEDVRQIDPRE